MNGNALRFRVTPGRVGDGGNDFGDHRYKRRSTFPHRRHGSISAILEAVAATEDEYRHHGRVSGGVGHDLVHSPDQALSAGVMRFM